MSIEKIPVTIITGFLGAGKTTLVRHLMQNPQGRRLGAVAGAADNLPQGCDRAHPPIIPQADLGTLHVL